MTLLTFLSDWKSPYRQLGLWLLIAVVSLTAVSATTWFGGLLGVAVAMPVAGVLAIYAIIIIFIGCREAWSQREKMPTALAAAWTPIIVIIGTTALALPIMWAVATGLTWATFFTNRAEYIEIARRADAGQFDAKGSALQQYAGVAFLIDDGPPQRLAFPMPGGFLDNWNGIVYDTSGRVAAARGFTRSGKFTAPPNIKGLFNATSYHVAT